MNRQPPPTYDLGVLRDAVSDLQESVEHLSAYLAEKARRDEVKSLMFEQPIKEFGALEERRELKKLAKREYAERSRRLSFLGEDLFGEPAWDLLLDLYVADVDRKRVSVTSACIAARVPSTTALRWIRLLEDRQLIERTVDPDDGRRMWVQLTPAGQSRMECLLRERLTNF